MFRAGTIGSSVLFGLAFFIATRNLSVVRVKDYLAIAAMGIIPIGIANEISALQQTFGVAAHSLVFLSTYLFSIGFLLFSDIHNSRYLVEEIHQEFHSGGGQIIGYSWNAAYEAGDREKGDERGKRPAICFSETDRELSPPSQNMI